jgi:hypothetical protein
MRMLCLAVATGLALSAPAISPASTHAQPFVTEPDAIAAPELSAVRKKVRVKKPAPPPPVQPFGWRPADPSFDQYGRPYRPPPGLPCPIDLGYGRWTSCWNR